MPKPNSNTAFGAGGFKIARPGKGRNMIQRSYADEVVRALNQLGCIEVKIVPTGDAKLIYGDLRSVLQIPVRTTELDLTGSIIKRAEISAVDNNFVTAVLWDEGSNDFVGDPVEVAKPFELRHNATGTEWGVVWTYTYASQQQRTRAATGYAATTQRVFPNYKAGDEIIVMFNDEHTGVAGATEYLDLNVDARRWLTETEGCDAAGGPVYAFVDRSPFAASAVGSNFA